MAYASFATIQEAWGNHDRSNANDDQEEATTMIGPSPSDVQYSRCGAPIIDDIMDMYTPLESQPRPIKPFSGPIQPKRKDVAPLPSEDTSHKEPVNQPSTLKRLDGTRPEGRKTRRYSEDDYGDSDDERDITVSNGRRIYKATSSRRRQPHKEAEHMSSNSSELIELAAYVLSGVMLIFLFESFITVGTNLRMLQY